MTRLIDILPPGIGEITASALAERIGAVLDGAGGRVIRGPAEWRDGGDDRIGFIESEKNRRELEQSGLGAVIAPLTGEYPGPAVRLRVADPKRAFAAVLRLFAPDPIEPAGIHPTAVVEDEAMIGAGASIGPYAVIRVGAVIGDGSWIGAHTYIGPGAVIGKNCRIHPNVVVLHRVTIGDGSRIFPGSVIGGDGFGFFYRPGEGHLKFPQTGGVLIGRDVEIHSNSCVDSGSLSPTVVGAGTRIANLVQIGHNDRVGRMNVVCGQVGMAGSVTTGDGVVLGGGAVVQDHTTIGDGAMCAGRSVIRGDLPASGSFAGDPARDAQQWLRETVAIKKLPELLKDVRALRAEIRSIEARLSDDQRAD